MHGVCGCVTVSCLAGFLAVSAARSQGSTNPPPVSSSIPPVVVTASRMARAVQDEPGAVHVVDRSRDPVAAAARTTPDALCGLPSVMAQKTAYGQGSPYLRGFTGFRTLALIDGVRLNNSVFRDGPNQYWNTIDPFAVARDEVAMGPGSVLYGSDAVGGTLNAIPFAPPAWEAGGVWHPELFLRGATAERSCVGRAQVAGRPDPRVGFTGGYTWKRFGDLIGGRTVGEQDHTGYDERDFDGRLDLYFDADTTLTLAHQTVVQEDAWRTHRTIYGIRWAGLTNGMDLVHTFDQRLDLDYARLHAANLDGLVNDLVLTVSRQVRRRTSTSSRATGRGNGRALTSKRGAPRCSSHRRRTPAPGSAASSTTTMRWTPTCASTTPTGRSRPSRSRGRWPTMPRTTRPASSSRTRCAFLTDASISSPAHATRTRAWTPAA